MTVETAKRDRFHATLDAYYTAFNAMDKQGILSVFTEDAVFIDHTMGRNMKGRGELAGFVDDTWRRCPYFHLEPTQFLIDGDEAAVQLFMSGAAKLDSSGGPKSGHQWRIPSTSFFKFSGTQISWKADCWNALSIPRQIGWLKTLPAMLR